MNINTLFLAGFALIEFGIILYLLFKVDNFQKKVKNFLRENLSKDEKILELRSIIKKVQLELQELKFTLKETINFKDELIKEKEAQEKKLKYLEDEMLKTSVLTKKETPKAEEKPVDKVVEKLRKRKK
mgnify:CR=1 FL=1